MSMASTIPAPQCRRFTVEKSIKNLYNNNQEFRDQFLDFTLALKKLGEVPRSRAHKNTWHCIPLISIGNTANLCFLAEFLN